MSTASLALLQGGKKAASATPATPKAAPEPEMAETENAAAETEGDDAYTPEEIKKMTGKQIDALISENEIEVPEGWKSLKVADKQDWLIRQMTEDGEEGAEEGAADTPVEDAPVEEVGEAEGQTHSPEPEEAPATSTEVAPVEAAAPAKKSGKVTKTSKKVEGEVVGKDAIADLVQEIENLKEQDARDLVGELSDATEQMYFKLGGVLSVVQNHGWFQPYASFKEYVEGEHGIQYRKAMYLISIYNDIAESGVAWDKVKGLGWTKLKELSPILTKENVDEWVKAVAGKTTLEIIEMVKNVQAKNSPKAVEDQTSKTVTTKTFKVHEDQRATIEAAIGKAKEISGTDVDTAALEFICLDFLGGSTKGVKEQLAKIGLDAALELFVEAFPSVNLTAEVGEGEEANAAAE